MQSNRDRIKEMIEYVSTFNDATPGEGISRFSYSENDAKVRKYLIGICEDIGLKVRVDAVGNVFARFVGSDENLPVIMSGSHIDSVKNGGRFDGLVGSIGALEAVRVMIEEGYKPKNSIDVVFFAEEEGSNFQVPVMGSKLLTGKLTVDDIKRIKNEEGVTAYEIIKNAGYDPDNMPNDVIVPGMVKNMIELHIEQSVRLDQEGHTIGIISGIAGLNWFTITLEGVQNHAGATPMFLRKDPMVVASKVIAEIDGIAKKINDTIVATVGHIEVTPNIPNAIPKEVKFVVDVRDIQQETIQRCVDEIKEATMKYAKENGVKFTVEKIASSEAIKINDCIKDVMVEQAEKLNLDYVLMPSGAVHDSNYMAEVTDVAMIFVPSVDGRSHVKEEYTDWDDIKAGVDLLLQYHNNVYCHFQMIRYTTIV